MAKKATRQELTLMVQHRGLKDLLHGNRAFRRFLWTLFTDAGIFYPSYSHRSPHDTAYNEGRRAMGLEVLHMLKHVEPGILGLLEQEGNLLAQDLKLGANNPEEQDDDPTTPDDDFDGSGADGQPASPGERG